ncbi:hypothetical protein [Nonomuraea africana]|uniref:Uncharacterized protein n=1 Tax=Nonomuraea africana TaxID=46171 RepID=A0ABR9KI30_9ACTN|nr:hypothetical protein [Nonomuraea africana]MBE1561677.1 hypothetical protein [Nonomuraea africana]
MSKRSRRRRALSSGAPAWMPGSGPGEPHWSDDDLPFDFPSDEPPGGEGGVREPRRPKPTPPVLSEELDEPDPPITVKAR